jgi:hypothetical protein
MNGLAKSFQAATRACLLAAALGCAHVAEARAECSARTDFDQIVAVVAERFYDKKFNGIDWPGRAVHFRKRVRCGSSSSAAYPHGLTEADIWWWSRPSMEMCQDFLESKAMGWRQRSKWSLAAGTVRVATRSGRRSSD